MVDYLKNEYDVPLENILKFVNKKSLEEVGSPELTTIRAGLNCIKDGQASALGVFGPPD